jgi:hypothetical protein
MGTTSGDSDRAAYSKIEIQNNFFCMKWLVEWLTFLVALTIVFISKSVFSPQTICSA